jgi:hypothetical protein
MLYYFKQGHEKYINLYKKQLSFIGGFIGGAFDVTLYELRSCAVSDTTKLSG